MFPTIPGTGLQEAIGPASLLKSDILAAGILFSPYLLSSRDLLPFKATAEQEWPLHALSPICKAGQETILCPTQSAGCLDEWDASCQPGMRSDRGRPGPRWARVTQVARLCWRPKECCRSMNYWRPLWRVVASTDGKE